MTKPKFGPRKGKYNASGRHEDGKWMASASEADRYLQLKQLEIDGFIERLECQPVFKLNTNGHHVCDYRADFRYLVIDQERGIALRSTIEDVKGMITPEYKLKSKLFRALYPGYDFHEIPAKDVPKWAGLIPVKEQ